MSDKRRKSSQSNNYQEINAGVVNPGAPNAAAALYQGMLNLMAAAQQQSNNAVALPGPNGAQFLMPSFTANKPGTSGSSDAGSTRRKPWAKVPDDDDDDDDEDEDFAPPLNKKSKPQGQQNRASYSSMKKGHSSNAAKRLSQVKNLPDKFMGRPIVSLKHVNDCVACGVYLGEVMLLPCGHAKFCTRCTNKIHEKSNKLKKLIVCPVESCLVSVSGWVRLRNVMM